MRLLKQELKTIFQYPFTRAFVAMISIVVLGLVFNADGAFFKFGTHRDMLRHVSVYGILACGMTLVIISGGIDLSVGSVLGFSAVLFSILIIHLGMPFWLAIIIVLSAGILLGVLSGISIGRFKIQPFIATLAMMVFARGLSKFISGGKKISTAIQQADGTYKYADIPEIFNFINAKLFFNSITVVTVIFIICLFITWVVLSRLRWGRYIYAIGGNEEAARMSGIPLTHMKIFIYGLAAFFSAVAGICQAAQELQGDPESGQGYELLAIAMVVIGGTSLMGGRGDIWLTFFGIITIGYLEKILSINAIPESTRLMLTGIIIISAVLFQKTRNR